MASSQVKYSLLSGYKQYEYHSYTGCVAVVEQTPLSRNTKQVIRFDLTKSTAYL